MKNFCKIGFLVLCLTFSLCSVKEENITSNKNAKVLILGNSMVKRSPAPDIDWYGNWGMAATSEEKDFVHVFTKLLKESKKYNSVKVDALNIAYWENDFASDLNQNSDILAQPYDILIVRLGDNVSNTDEYYNALNDMINHFKREKTRVIITDVIWHNEITKSIHKQIALDNNYKFISFVDFQNDPGNYSWGLFQNTQVAAHPSDKGMEHLAVLLSNKSIEIY